jgi:hypothetical protein
MVQRELWTIQRFHLALQKAQSSLEEDQEEKRPRVRTFGAGV